MPIPPGFTEPRFLLYGTCSTDSAARRAGWSDELFSGPIAAASRQAGGASPSSHSISLFKSAFGWCPEVTSFEATPFVGKNGTS